MLTEWQISYWRSYLTSVAGEKSDEARILCDQALLVERLVEALKNYEAAHPFGRLGEEARALLAEIK